MPQTSEIICDICSAPNPTWCYPAISFICESVSTIHFIQESRGDWAICSFCHDIIQSGDREALTVRALDTLILECPDLLEHCEEIKAQMEDLHAGFFLNRIGEPVRINQEAA